MSDLLAAAGPEVPRSASALGAGFPTPPHFATFGTACLGRDVPRDGPALQWIWQGYFAAGCSTLFTAQWKTGKTTLLTLLLSRLQTGGTLAGLTVAKTSALVISEEPPQLWRPRIERYGLDDVVFLFEPFAHKPKLLEWLELLDYVDALRIRHGCGLIAFDTLASLMPEHSEQDGTAALNALLPLRRFKEAGVCLVLVHHPRKGATAAGQTARGTGALAGHADVVLEMHLCRNAAPGDRRRLLTAHSRFDLTPRSLVLELDPEATDYRNLGEGDPEEFLRSWPVLRMLLEDAERKLSRAELLKTWPPDHPRPVPSTLYQWLQRAVALNLVQREGSGRKCDPFRYWLRYVADTWREQDPIGHQIGELYNQSTRAFHEEREEKWRSLRPPEPVAVGSGSGQEQKRSEDDYD